MPVQYLTTSDDCRSDGRRHYCKYLLEKCPSTFSYFLLELTLGVFFFFFIGGEPIDVGDLAATSGTGGWRRRCLVGRENPEVLPLCNSFCCSSSLFKKISRIPLLYFFLVFLLCFPELNSLLLHLNCLSPIHSLYISLAVYFLPWMEFPEGNSSYFSKLSL